MAISSITDDSVDPLEELDRRISEARRVDASNREASAPADTDPLAALESLISRARQFDADMPEGDLLDEPLRSLVERMRAAPAVPEAKSAPATGEGPVERIRNWIEEEGGELGTVTDPLTRRRSSTSTTAASRLEESDLAARLGGEILEMLAGQPLSGAERIEAIRRTLAALDDPSEQRIRRVLRTLLGIEDPG